jgi:alkanesulfonate monooxygenase SsuD/methylene tetrahydromethanopterin reductase-like flavin-dependent oxidoreductase (luciferase family)
MRQALFLPPFGELSDAAVLAELAHRAEGRGWDGLFLWDHVIRRPDEPQDIADVWVAMTAMALATRRLRFGAMITPLVRRRPQILARQTVTLDRLSQGRLIVGLGLGVDSTGELSRFGELLDERRRGDLLDEGSDLLVRLWSGAQVEHRGNYFTADGVRFLPRPVQQPHPPLWMAARGAARRPVRRAARYDGLFAIEVDADGLGAMARVVENERGSLNGFDIAVRVEDQPDLAAAGRAGATWAMWSPEPGISISTVEARIDAGP